MLYLLSGQAVLQDKYILNISKNVLKTYLHDFIFCCIYCKVFCGSAPAAFLFLERQPKWVDVRRCTTLTDVKTIKQIYYRQHSGIELPLVFFLHTTYISYTVIQYAQMVTSSFSGTQSIAAITSKSTLFNLYGCLVTVTVASAKVRLDMFWGGPWRKFS